jgi:lipid II:glycine glycyltransferase (peptidoglycan interpeptide bridge formation enzyme)
LTYVQQGAGNIVQAVKGDRILSSALVLKAEQGAYYQSGGTSAEGMACGASHYLLVEIARALQQAGMRSFNLGGTRDASSGLALFKSRFGARVVKLESATFHVGSGSADAWFRKWASILRRALTLPH